MTALSLTTPPVLALALTAALLSACNGGNETATAQRATMTSSIPGINAAPYPVPKAIVSRADLDSSTTLFRYCFRLNSTGTIMDTVSGIPWDLLTAHLPQDSAGMDRAIAFHYGLAKPNFLMAWSYWYVDTIATGPDSLHTLHAVDSLAYTYTGAKLDSMSITTWDSAHMFANSPLGYANNVQVNRLKQGDASDHWATIDTALDARATFMYWERALLRLKTDNEDSVTPADSLWLVVHCTAEWRTDPLRPAAGIAHTLTAHLRAQEPGKPFRDLIDDSASDPTHPYHMRGADLGTLVPPYRRALPSH
jgi:hypothetical protein